MKIGILGVGHLAGYLVQGAAGHDFVLSPGSGPKAQTLAAAHGCTVAAGNQDVIDRCDHILVCLPAQSGLGTLRGLIFAEDQSVCSAMAGVSQADLAQAVAPARACVTMMPGHANALGVGPSLLYPPDPDWAGFLAACGPVHELARAQDFETAAVFGALSGASLAFMARLADWFAGQGLDPALARQLVAETLRGNAEVVLQARESLAEICAGVATPGGITEQLVGDLDRDGALSAWAAAMTRVLHRMAPDRA